MSPHVIGNAILLNFHFWYSNINAYSISTKGLQGTWDYRDFILSMLEKSQRGEKHYSNF